MEGSEHVLLLVANRETELSICCSTTSHKWAVRRALCRIRFIHASILCVCARNVRYNTILVQYKCKITTRRSTPAYPSKQENRNEERKTWYTRTLDLVHVESRSSMYCRRKHACRVHPNKIPIYLITGTVSLTCTAETRFTM